MNELIFTNKIINAYEKKILTEIVTTVESKDIHKLASIIYILKANNTLYSNEFDNLSKSRLISIVATLEANIEVYFGSVEFLSRKTSPQLETRGKCAESIGQGAIVGGLVGGLTGLYSGCKTGIVLGFNPGSAAAGCMGGLIVGTIGGMIGGAIEGAIQCALF